LDTEDNIGFKACTNDEILIDFLSSQFRKPWIMRGKEFLIGLPPLKQFFIVGVGFPLV